MNIDISDMKILSLLFTVMLMASCSSITNDNRKTALENTLYAYQTSMRWGYWDMLVNYHDAATKPPLSQMFDNVRVTSYEIAQPPIIIKDNQVIQTAEIQYILNDEQRLRRVLDKQDWHYNQESNSWYLSSPLPQFRRK